MFPVSLPRGASGLKSYPPGRLSDRPSGLAPTRSEWIEIIWMGLKLTRPSVSLPRGASRPKSFCRFANCPAPCFLEGSRGHPPPHKARSHSPIKKERAGQHHLSGSLFLTSSCGADFVLSVRPVQRVFPWPRAVRPPVWLRAAWAERGAPFGVAGAVWGWAPGSPWGRGGS